MKTPGDVYLKGAASAAPFMLLLLGGFLGSGRRLLAKRIAKKYGFYRFDIETRKLPAHAFNVRRELVEKREKPKTDADRIKLFEKVVEDLALLSKMYDNIVLDSTFHRERVRDFFFKSTKKIFDRVEFVWIDSDEEAVGQHLEEMAQKKLIASITSALNQRELAKQQFEPFASPPKTFLYQGKTGSAKRLLALAWESPSTR